MGWLDLADPSLWYPPQNEDSEEEEQCTISTHWAFQPESKRWSHVGSSDLLAPPSPSLPETSSCESVLTKLSVTSLPAITVSLPREPVHLPLQGHVPNPNDLPLLSPTQGQKVPEEKSKKQCSRSFLRHLESLRRKEKGDSRKTGPERNPTTSERPPKASSFRSCRGFLSAGFYRAKNWASTSASGSDGGTREAWPVAMFWHAQQAHRGNYLVHVPGDHKPGTFPRSLSIESLCPEYGHRQAGWQPARHWGYEGRRGSCGSTGSHASTYDNMPELYPAEPILAGAEAEDEVEGGGSYAHLDDILQHVWGLQQRVELWSQAMYPDLEPGDKEDEDEEEEEEEATSSVEIATAEVKGQAEAMAKAETPALGESLSWIQAKVQPVATAQAPDEVEPLSQVETEAPAWAQDNEQEPNSGGEPTSASSLSVEGHSISDTGASSSELDSSGNSTNETEAAGSLVGLQASVPLERRDSGVGASLTRPCRWVFGAGLWVGVPLPSLSFPLPSLSFLSNETQEQVLVGWVITSRELVLANRKIEYKT